MRILLTGATGYLGLHLTSSLLEAGHDVTAMLRAPERLGALARDDRLTVHRADLLDEPRMAKAVDGQDACVHAALIWGSPETDLDLLDARTAARLFDAAGSAGVRRTVFVSSTAVHRPFAGEMSERDALTPTDVYGAAKAAAEMLLWSACATHAMEGVVLRPGPIVGPPALTDGAFRSDRRIAAMVAAASRGEAIDVVRGEGRQFVAVEDVARTVEVAVAAPEASGTYLCIDREITSWESVARAAVESTGARSAVRVTDARYEHPTPRFVDSRLAVLLGEPLDSRDAMERHIAHLARRQAP